jgi:RHH-type proline utilization regulon transcriptional repressor/proline dehydrogenase/delta 1-pyrroline-5-carboxylate dehydrogenase
VLVSAFDSAGQRCSALRVLCVQEEAADRLLQMLLGAMAELRNGPPSRLSTDVGPVIDDEAKANIERHIAQMRAKGRRVHPVAGHDAVPLDRGTFVAPTLIEIDSIAELQREVFGPVLHFVRFRREELDGLVAQVNATGYGLTMGLHTRIDETIARVVAAAHAGNVYVNRNMVGAVVGVQPFGGEGLSGTGPKAGGPLYLYRLLAQRPGDVLARALDGADATHSKVLPGPTGERNVYTVAPRSAVLCLASNDADRKVQLEAVMKAGSRAIWPAEAKPCYDTLPAPMQAHVVLARDCFAPEVSFDCVLLHGSTAELANVQRKLAQRDGPVVGVERLEPGETAVPLERLVVERALSINTAAAGGNASLMTIG